MTEFHAQLTARALEAARLLAAAQRSGDDFSVDVHRADLDTIVGIAHEHGVALPDLGLDASAA
jgi:hypothetical protein